MGYNPTAIYCGNVEDKAGFLMFQPHQRDGHQLGCDLAADWRSFPLWIRNQFIIMI